MVSAVRWLFLLVGLVSTVACGRGCSPGQSTTTSDSPPAIQRGGELFASLRGEPGNYNRYFEAQAPTELLSLLTQAKLARVNRATDELEPALAESWTTSDGLTYTLKLRPNVRFSDGTPFTSADVLFSVKAASDAPGTVMVSAITVAGQPLTVAAVDPLTVTIRFPEPYAPALRVLDNLPILPRHALQAAYDTKAMREAWTPARPASNVIGLGPFVLKEHVSGQRLVFTRNPHYWRQDRNGTALPYLDQVTVVILPDQNAEALQLEAGELDLMTDANVRPEDYARFKQLRDRSRLQIIDGGVGLDPYVLWFNLKPKANDPKPWIKRKEFRQALSYAANRQAIADTVYLGAAVPVYGPITPRNATWTSTSTPSYPYDAAKARQLLASLGMRDRDADGILDDSSGRPVRFSILLRQGHTIRERIASVLQQNFRDVGVGVDLVGIDIGGIGQRWQKSDYDGIFHGFDTSSTDPAMNLDFWLSSSHQHFWNPSQPSPGTAWERRIDELMHQQIAASSLAERQRLFAEVQRIFGDELPALYFVVPKIMIAASNRVQNLQPAPQIPHLLWSADTIAVSSRRQQSQ